MDPKLVIVQVGGFKLKLSTDLSNSISESNCIVKSIAPTDPTACRLQVVVENVLEEELEGTISLPNIAYFGISRRTCNENRLLPATILYY